MTRLKCRPRSANKGARSATDSITVAVCWQYSCPASIADRDIYHRSLSGETKLHSASSLHIWYTLQTPI